MDNITERETQIASQMDISISHQMDEKSLRVLVKYCQSIAPKNYEVILSLVDWEDALYLTEPIYQVECRSHNIISNNFNLYFKSQYIPRKLSLSST